MRLAGRASPLWTGIGWLFALFLLVILPGVSAGDQFSVKEGVFPVKSLKPHMRGTALTVFQGGKIEQFPVEILGVIAQRSAPNRLVLIKAVGDRVMKAGGVAAGMSGSPVYIDGKLLGAIGFGWKFGDHSMALVTPVEEMLKIPPMEGADVKSKGPHDGLGQTPKDASDHVVSQDQVGQDAASGAVSQDQGLSSPLLIGGVSPRYGRLIGERLSSRVSAPGGGEIVASGSSVLSPGASIGVALVVGDVSVGTLGTVTAVDKDKFLAFGHPFMGRGSVKFFATEASVVGVIPSLETPFKLGTLGGVIGTVLQDRAQGLYGRIGMMPQGNDYEIRFHDLDSGKEAVRRFKAVVDPFVSSLVVPPAVAGCVEDLWGRTGQGTGEVKITVEGRGMPEGWNRTNFFLSDSDLPEKIFQEFSMIHSMLPLNPFLPLEPLSFRLDVKVTQTPKVLYIEKVQVPKDRTFSPGEMIGVDVWLRPWRSKVEKRTFSVKIPADARGDVEVLVRGGGVGEMEQESIKEGRRSIESFEGLLRELSAAEASNEIIVEVLCRRSKDREREDSTKLLSEIKEQRVKEGSLKVLKTNYYVEGLLRVPLKMTAEGDKERGEEE
ncbi:SpoIVB peptidase S55 [Thermanaerovibrio velox DSM 12556]|uniref:SpoIVB peptidase S55 n=1 Tax=Thermanaerovibrio velox DSM 12556 TaxID=926567 RepID=H0UR87_9BACT|nr:SpoIVB peptidase S55 domain-containing protein [Thermanaerovibrio velox]EHM09843.1 SpoIVB peptidase S55 [Thermanaerovibrio velox DSM 12556]